MAVHLFILYWAMLSFITPPVALGAYAAASIAGSNPIQTGFAAMKLGSVIYFIPFVFVTNTGLVLQGSAVGILVALLTAFGGIWLIVAGLQGYLQGAGKVESLPVRALLLLAGGVLAFSPQLVAGISA
jgi:TRAP-type uncharacterized transport system fused permease subunit